MKKKLSQKHIQALKELDFIIAQIIQKYENELEGLAEDCIELIQDLEIDEKTLLTAKIAHIIGTYFLNKIAQSYFFFEIEDFRDQNYQ
jgi:hypothetical protein